MSDSRDSTRADGLMHELQEVRRVVAEELFELARKIARRDKWFIGGFLGEVQSEWDEKERTRR